MRKISPPIIGEVHRFAYDVLAKVRHFSDEEKTDLLKTTKQSIVDYFHPILDLSNFRFFYPTNGITDGLNHYSLASSNLQIDIEDGDYEYLRYVHSAHDTVGIVKYVTNPSARDGNIRTSYGDGRIALDCAYAGTTRNDPISTSNVETVFVGLSKTFGLPNVRSGFVFSNRKIEPLHTMIHSRLYFNPMNCVLCTALMEKFELGFMHKLLLEKQIEAAKDMIPSDVVFIAIGSNGDIRGSVNRVCLQLNLD